MKYGFRMEKRGMALRGPLVLLLVLHKLDTLGCDRLPAFQAAAVADHHHVAFLEPGNDFGFVGGLDAQHHRRISILSSGVTTSTVTLSPL